MTKAKGPSNVVRVTITIDGSFGRRIEISQGPYVVEIHDYDIRGVAPNLLTLCRAGRRFLLSRFCTDPRSGEVVHPNPEICPSGK